MARILQIAQLGNPVLRQTTTHIEDLNDPSIQDLFDDMIATVLEVGGYGLAAPQVYHSSRAFVLKMFPSKKYPDSPVFGPIIMANPEILAHSENMTVGWEGCLSTPGIRALVPRFEVLDVSYFTREGKQENRRFAGVLSRAFQHEYDHLEGLVYLDRIESTRDIATEKECLRLIAQEDKK